MLAQSGLWVESQDKKSRAYISVNTAATSGSGATQTGSATIGIKRLTMN
jgi:hypothetical protein